MYIYCRAGADEEIIVLAEGEGDEGDEGAEASGPGWSTKLSAILDELDLVNRQHPGDKVLSLSLSLSLSSLSPSLSCPPPPPPPPIPLHLCTKPKPLSSSCEAERHRDKETQSVPSPPCPHARARRARVINAPFLLLQAHADGGLLLRGPSGRHLFTVNVTPQMCVCVYSLSLPLSLPLSLSLSLSLSPSLCECVCVCQVVIFSQFTSFLDILQSALALRQVALNEEALEGGGGRGGGGGVGGGGGKIARLDGSMARHKRNEAISSFTNDPDVRDVLGRSHARLCCAPKP
jgi:hypothetical protein